MMKKRKKRKKKKERTLVMRYYRRGRKIRYFDVPTPGSHRRIWMKHISTHILASSWRVTVRICCRVWGIILRVIWWNRRILWNMWCACVILVVHRPGRWRWKLVVIGVV